MNKKIKRILILIFALLFSLAIPLAILYCQGYRFDFGNRKLVKTGAFSLQAKPTGCEVYLDEKLIRKTDFLFSSVFIKNLLPQKYTVRIKKEGYLPWEKTLEIKEGLVVEAKNITLFPKNINFSLFLPNIENYFFSPDEKKIALKKIDEEGWSLGLFNLESDSQKTILGNEDLSKKKVNFLDLNWNSDSGKILLKTEVENKIKYFIVDFSGEKQIIPLEISNIKEVSFSPNNSQEIFFVKDLSLFRFNFSKKNSLPEEILKNLLTYRIFDGSIIWLNQDGFSIRSDFSGKKLEIFNTEPFLVKDSSEYKIEIFSWAIFLKENDNFYQLNPSLKTFEKFSESVKNIKLSPDSKELVITNNYEILVLFLADINGQPFRKSGEKIFLTRFSQNIDEIFWLNPDYLIFNTGEKIKIAEIDNRDRVNIIELASFQNPKIFWNENYKRFYLLSEGDIYSLDDLLP